MAKFGLVVRDDPPRVIDFNSRQWGEPADGWALSIEVLPGRDPGDPSALSVVLRNVAPTPQTLRIPGWLALYRLEVADASGTPVPLTGFGRTSLDPARQTGTEVTLQPGAGHDTMIPLGSFFDLKPRGNYRVKASATPGTATLTSNTATITT